MRGIEGEPCHGEPTPQQTKHDQAPAQGGRHSTRVQREQQPYSGGVNKPEVPPPKELQLPFEPNLPRHEQQTGRLDPEVERLMRAYAEAEADGDPKKAERLFKRYKKNSFLREWFKNGSRTTPLAYGPHPPEED